MPPHDERADARAAITAQFTDVDQALRALIQSKGEQPAGHPRLNSTIAEDAGWISHRMANTIRMLTLLADLASLEFDLDMAWFMTSEYRELADCVLVGLRNRTGP